MIPHSGRRIQRSFTTFRMTEKYFDYPLYFYLKILLGSQKYIGRASSPPEWVEEKFRAFEWHGGWKKEVRLSHAEFFMKRGWEYGWDF